ncbi:hypothetical protein AAHE18_08G251800 [Arachis hypogaea]
MYLNPSSSFSHAIAICYYEDLASNGGRWCASSLLPPPDLPSAASRRTASRAPLRTHWASIGSVLNPLALRYPVDCYPNPGLTHPTSLLDPLSLLLGLFPLYQWLRCGYW